MTPGIIRFAIVCLLLSGCGGHYADLSGKAPSDGGGPAVTADTVRINLDRAGKLFRDGAYADAVPLLADLLRSDSTLLEAYDLLGLSMTELGYCGQAIGTFDRGLSRDSGNVVLLTHAAESSLECGYPENAKGYYLRLVTVKPSDARAATSLGKLFYQEGDYDSAVMYFGKSIKADSTSFISHYYLGSSYAAIKEYERAISHYENAIRLRPSFIPALKDLAVIYYNLDSINLASYTYSQAIAVQPSNAEFKMGLANCHYRNARYDIALPLYREAEVPRYQATSLFQQAMCYFYLGRYDSAKTAFGKTLALDADNPSASFNLGLVLMMTQEYGDAVRRFEDAIRFSRKPMIGSAYDRIGVANYELKKKRSSLRAFQRAIDENPYNPRPHFNLGILYENLYQDTAKAIGSYRRVVELSAGGDPEDATLLAKARERLAALQKK